MANKNQIILILIFMLSFSISGILSLNISPPRFKVSKQSSALNFSNNLLTIFDLGQKRLLADFLWITTLLESDLEHYDKNDYNSWMFLRFNSIATLDPLFKINYQFGGQYLGIIKDDLKGAERIFLRGLKHYPNDYLLNFSLGSLYALELSEYNKAAHYYEKTINHKQAPINIKTLIIKLKFMDSKNLEVTFNLLTELKKNTKDKFLIKNIKSDLYKIKAQIDLKCLNSNLNKSSCDIYDYEGNKYIYEDGKFTTQKEVKKYEFHKKD